LQSFLSLGRQLEFGRLFGVTFIRAHLQAVQLDTAIGNGQEAARQLRPTAAVVIRDFRVSCKTCLVRVAAADHAAILSASVFNRPFLDLFGAAEEGFAPFLGQLGEGMRAVDPLQQEVDTISQPGKNGVGVDEVVEAMAV
jgi:hypothetical protein